MTNVALGSTMSALVYSLTLFQRFFFVLNVPSNACGGA